MSEDLVLVEPSDALRPARAASTARLVLPQLIVDAGPVAVARFLEFFAARIANRRTRAAYGRAVGQFLAWCEARGLALAAVGFLKGKSAIRIHREYLGRQRNFTGYHFWARGYCVSTVGVAEEVIRDYIRKQEADEKKQEKLELG